MFTEGGLAAKIGHDDTDFLSTKSRVAFHTHRNPDATSLYPDAPRLDGKGILAQMEGKWRIYSPG